MSLAEVVDRLPEALTGADVYALCEQATRAALDRAVASVERGTAIGRACLFVCLFACLSHYFAADHVLISRMCCYYVQLSWFSN